MLVLATMLNSSFEEAQMGFKAHMEPWWFMLPNPGMTTPELSYPPKFPESLDFFFFKKWLSLCWDSIFIITINQVNNSPLYFAKFLQFFTIFSSLLFYFFIILSIEKCSLKEISF